MLKFLKGILGLLFVLFVFGLFVEPKDGASSAAVTPNPVRIKNFSWSTGSFGSIMEASFTIKNELPISIKDVEITCKHSSPSGTYIDSNSRTIYEIIKAGRTRTFDKVNMGFIHSQASRSSCKVVGMTKMN